MLPRSSSVRSKVSPAMVRLPRGLYLTPAAAAGSRGAAPPGARAAACSRTGWPPAPPPPSPTNSASSRRKRGMSVAGKYGSYEALTLHQRPGVAPPAAVDRKPAALDERAGALDHGLALGRRQQLRERRRQRPGGEALEVLQHRRRHRLVAEVPDHRAQLGLDVEAEAVVDGVDGAVLAEQAVAALAVGVVGDQVEGADALEALVMLGALAQREVVLLEVGGDEALQRALAVRSLLAAHRERHHVPAEGLREVPGGQLAAEEAGRKVPEWPLAAAGLVDGERAGVVEPRLDQERGVAAPRQPALHGEVAAQEHVADARGRHHSLATTTWPLARGQTWPAGSFGSPHIGQVARPARTSVRARSTKAAAWARVIAKRAEAGSAAGGPPSSSSSTCSLAMTTTRSRSLS